MISLGLRIESPIIMFIGKKYESNPLSAMIRSGIGLGQAEGGIGSQTVNLAGMLVRKKCVSQTSVTWTVASGPYPHIL